MDETKLRAWRSHRQGLDGSLAGFSAREVLERGWARSVGGAAPYLTLFSRAGIRRKEADAAAVGLQIHELPSARGCTYVLPSGDFALGLAVGRQFAETEMKVARKLGVTDDEIALLSDAIVKALEAGPMDPDGLRAAVGPAARNLGPEGVKKGITTTVPVALGILQVSGTIRRVPVNGRLDQQRFKYTLWNPNPLTGWIKTPEEAFIELAAAYFRWTGGATAAEFQWFSGLGVKAAKQALEPLGLVAFADGILMLPSDREAFEAFQVPPEPHYAVISSLDNIGHLRRNVRSLVTDADFDQFLKVGQNSLMEMTEHAIVDRGRLVGRWLFDPAAGEIVWQAFIKEDTALRQTVAATEAFIREDLEDFRSFSLDSPKSRAPGLQALREARA